MATWKRLTLPLGEEGTIDVNMDLVCYMLSTQNGGTRLYFGAGEATARSVMESVSEVHIAPSIPTSEAMLSR